jgi:hypothetical protein
MKTTIDIPEALYKKAKIRAVEQGSTLKAVVLNALSLDLEANRPRELKDAATHKPYWADRKLTPAYRRSIASGRLKSKTDSAIAISQERDAR